MKALILAAVLSQAPDAPWRIEKAGTVLQVDAVVTTPEAAQQLDIALRQAQADAATYKAVAYVSVPVAVVAVVAAVVVGVVAAKK